MLYLSQMFVYQDRVAIRLSSISPATQYGTTYLSRISYFYCEGFFSPMSPRIRCRNSATLSAPKKLRVGYSLRLGFRETGQLLLFSSLYSLMPLKYHHCNWEHLQQRIRPGTQISHLLSIICHGPRMKQSVRFLAKNQPDHLI